MKNGSLSKKVLLLIIITVLLNTITLVFWYNLRVSPIISNASNLKNNISQNELKHYYKNVEELLLNLTSIVNKYNVKFKIEDFDDHVINDNKVSGEELFLFSDIIKVENNFYLLSTYLNKNLSTATMIIELILFQIIIVILIMIFIFVFASTNIINPVEKIIVSIRNYKLGKKPIKVEVNNEFDLIQNELVNLVDVIEKEKAEQNRIIASISHDIKTPLTSVIGYSDLIVSSKMNKQEMIEYTSKINEKSLHIKNLLGDFDDYLVSMSNKTLKLDSVLIKDIVKDLINDYKLELKNLGINFNVKTKLSNNYINVDILKIKRIFSNIIQNSIRFVPKDGKIDVLITSDSNYYKFIISDNGCGVSDEIINKIFNPLFTTDNSRKISGLGLSICREFTLLHGGDIKAYNNNGLTIEFTIPK